MENDREEFELRSPAAWVRRATDAARRGDADTAVLLFSATLESDSGVIELVRPERAILDCLARAVDEVGRPGQQEELIALVTQLHWDAWDEEPVSDTMISWLRDAGEVGLHGWATALGAALARRPDRASRDEAYALLRGALESGEADAGRAAVQLLQSEDDNVRERLGELARLGDAEASRVLAWVTVDTSGRSWREDALMWLYRAQHQGSPQATGDLALLLLSELPPNVEEARYWLGRSTAWGEPADGEALRAACEGDPTASLRTAGLLSEHGLVDTTSAGPDPVLVHWIGQAIASTDRHILLWAADSALRNLQGGVALFAAERAFQLAEAECDDEELVVVALDLALIQAFVGRAAAARSTLTAVADRYSSVMPDSGPDVDLLRDSIHADPETRRRARQGLATFDPDTDSPTFIALSHDMDGDHEQALAYWAIAAQSEDNISAAMAESPTRWSEIRSHHLPT